MNQSQLYIILTRDVGFEHNEIYHTLYVPNMKIILKITSLKMYVLYLYHISLCHWINTFQECQQLPLVIDSVYRVVGDRSFCCSQLSYFII